MPKPIKPNINLPEGFAENGQKTDFPSEKLDKGFDPVDPDVLSGDNLNKFIDDTYKGLNYAAKGVSDLYKGCILYDVNEIYNSNSIVFNISEKGEVKLYRSLTENNTGKFLSDPINWQSLTLGGEPANREIGLPILTLSNSLNYSEIWLEGAEISKTTYSALYEIYGDTYGISETEGNFILPDFRNRTLWGTPDSTFGYIEAGLPNITGQTGNRFRTMFPVGDNIGALYSANESNNGGGGSNGVYSQTINFDASRCSSVYKDDITTVQPPAMKVRIKTRYK